ncbi:MAG: hypothetical protein ACOC46_04625, partial [Pirellulales bacterium]
YNRYYWGGRLVSLATNLLFGCHITDEPTCYKSFRRTVLESLELRARRFEFCPELTGKLLRAGYRIVEVPIRYEPRSFRQGKKIRATDGLLALWTLLLIRLGWDEVLKRRPAVGATAGSSSRAGRQMSAATRAGTGAA